MASFLPTFYRVQCEIASVCLTPLFGSKTPCANPCLMRMFLAGRWDWSSRGSRQGVGSTATGASGCRTVSRRSTAPASTTSSSTSESRVVVWSHRQFSLINLNGLALCFSAKGEVRCVYVCVCVRAHNCSCWRGAIERSKFVVSFVAEPKKYSSRRCRRTVFGCA